VRELIRLASNIARRPEAFRGKLPKEQKSVRCEWGMPAYILPGNTKALKGKIKQRSSQMLSPK
jgi:hypothetical protein